MNSKINKEWIIYFASGNYWTGAITGRHHILKRLSYKYNILFINSLGLASIANIKKNTIVTRIKNKLKSYGKYLKKTEYFFIFSPISIPLGISLTDLLNNILVLFQIRMIIYFLKIKSPIIWVCHPKAALLFEKINHKKLIYNYSDKFTSYREIGNKDYIQSLDNRLLLKSDQVISNLLKNNEELVNSKISHKVSYIPHGVDFALFNTYLSKNIEFPTELSNLPRPIIGYYGTLTDSNNWEIIKYCANKRTDYSFVFIGNIRADVASEIRKISNVFFLGHREYSELPKYLKFFDVCIMFWKVTDWIYNSSPLKTKEFLAMGKPIVSVRIYELEKNYGDIISFADNKEEFLEKIDYELHNDSIMKIEQRVSRVRNDSWENITLKIEELLK